MLPAGTCRSLRDSLWFYASGVRLEELLQATEDKGEPDLPLRTRGAELALKYQAQLEPEGEEDELLPEGAFVV